MFSNSTELEMIILDHKVFNNSVGRLKAAGALVAAFPPGTSTLLERTKIPHFVIEHRKYSPTQSSSINLSRLNNTKNK